MKDFFLSRWFWCVAVAMWVGLLALIVYARRLDRRYERRRRLEIDLCEQRLDAEFRSMIHDWQNPKM